MAVGVVDAVMVASRGEYAWIDTELAPLVYEL